MKVPFTFAKLLFHRVHNRADVSKIALGFVVRTQNPWTNKKFHLDKSQVYF